MNRNLAMTADIRAVGPSIDTGSTPSFLKYPIPGEFVNESITTEQLQLVLGMTLQDLVGHLICHCHRARDP
jgi:hypothetical protein